MPSARRPFLRSLATLSLVTLLPGLVAAGGKTLRILVGYPPGGAVDTVARQVGEELRAAGYTVVVENKPGAAGRLVVESLIQAPADGGTVVLMPGGNVSIFQHVYPKLKYQLSDLVPLASVCTFSFGLAVGPGTPARTLKEFVAWAKANTTKAAYATPGGGTAMHFMGVMFAKKAGFDFNHIPYRGGAAAMPDVMGGTVPALATTLPNVLGPHRDGKLRVLAFTGDKPLPALPGVPTFKQEGYPELVLSESFGFFASAKTPEPMLAALESAIMAAAGQPRVTQAIDKLEFDSSVVGRKAYLALLKADLERWGPIVKSTGYKADD